MPSPRPAEPRLDLKTMSRLQKQLRSGDYDADLHVLRMVEGTRLPSYPHYLVLTSFAYSPVAELRVEILESLKLMVAKRAPIEMPESVKSVPTALLTFDWSDTPELSRELGKLYGDAGLIDVHRPIPGPFQGLDGFGGLLPLAAALNLNHPECTELFLSLGADIDDIGPVERFGPHRAAVEFAYECAARTPGDYHCLPLVLEQAMRRDIANRSTSRPTDPSTNSPTTTPASPRRRLSL